MSSDEAVPVKYKLSLEGAGLNLNQEVDQFIAVAIIQLVLGGTLPTHSTLPIPGKRTETRGAIPPSRTSLRGFIDQTGAKSIAAKIVAIAAYLRDVEGKAEFTREDIGGRFKNAGEAPPTNLPRDFKTAVQSGWIAEDHQMAGTFFITKEGDAAIEAKFEGARASTGRRRRKRRAGQSESPAGGETNSGEGE